jgi:hypothetical protein
MTKELGSGEYAAKLNLTIPGLHKRLKTKGQTGLEGCVSYRIIGNRYFFTVDSQQLDRAMKNKSKIVG